MTIEKALVRLPKESYKGEDYTVVVPLEDPEMLALAGEDWTIQIPLKAAPAKALGLLMEHMRRLPSPGQAYRVRKREIRVAMYDLLMDQLRGHGCDPGRTQAVAGGSPVAAAAGGGGTAGGQPGRKLRILQDQ